MREYWHIYVTVVVLCVALGIVIAAKLRKRRTQPVLQGYADAQPSEAIQKHELPGLAVAIAFPFKPGQGLLEPPVKQYKEYSRKQKADRADRLAAWLAAEREDGLRLTGFVQAHTQRAAAELGVELIEELPDTRVEPHPTNFG